MEQQHPRSLHSTNQYLKDNVDLDVPLTPCWFYSPVPTARRLHRELSAWLPACLPAWLPGWLPPYWRTAYLRLHLHCHKPVAVARHRSGGLFELVGERWETELQVRDATRRAGSYMSYYELATNDVPSYALVVKWWCCANHALLYENVEYAINQWVESVARNCYYSDSSKRLDETWTLTAYLLVYK